MKSTRERKDIKLQKYAHAGEANERRVHGRYTRDAHKKLYKQYIKLLQTIVIAHNTICCIIGPVYISTRIRKWMIHKQTRHVCVHPCRGTRRTIQGAPYNCEYKNNGKQAGIRGENTTCTWWGFVRDVSHETTHCCKCKRDLSWGETIPASRNDSNIRSKANATHTHTKKALLKKTLPSADIKYQLVRTVTPKRKTEPALVAIVRPSEPSVGLTMQCQIWACSSTSWQGRACCSARGTHSSPPLRRSSSEWRSRTAAPLGCAARGSCRRNSPLYEKKKQRDEHRVTDGMSTRYKWKIQGHHYDVLNRKARARCATIRHGLSQKGCQAYHWHRKPTKNDW